MGSICCSICAEEFEELDISDSDDYLEVPIVDQKKNCDTVYFIPF